MTDAYFYVNIPYHRPATPSFFRLLQRWSGPILLGTVLAALAWHQDHQAPSAQAATQGPAVAFTTTPAVAASTPPSTLTDPQDTNDLSSYTVAADQSTTQAQLNTTSQPAQTAAHPALVFHNCSMPRMEVRKDRNELITGVASVSSCDEAKITLWDTSR